VETDPRKKLVTNSLGKINFMQPMGRLKVPCFFSYKVFGAVRGKKDFFHFSLVPNVFPLSSQWVPNMFPKFPMCASHVFHSTSLLSHIALANVVLLSPI
jgi:hypothetical protein